MNYKPDEKEWVAYLYGEMDDADKRKFDQYILHDAEAREELARFQNLRHVLSGMEDKEVIAPTIVIGGESDARQRSARRWGFDTPYLRTIVSIAASLLLVILVGRLTEAQLQVSSQGLNLTFGAVPRGPEPEGIAAVTEEQVQQMINTSLEKNNFRMEASLAETEKKLDASIRKNLALNSGSIQKLVSEVSVASQQQIGQYVESLRAENMQQVKDYFQLTATEQKQYIENLLVDFAKYLQQQRNDDLQLVQTRMNSLEQNTDLFRQETEQILSSIITTVGSPESTETKN